MAEFAVSDFLVSLVFLTVALGGFWCTRMQVKSQPGLRAGFGARQ